MFKGTTIEELINSVCRAEEHARQTQEIEARQQAAASSELGQEEPEWREAIEVA